MRWNIVGAFIRNNPFGTEIAFRKGLERCGEHVTAIDPSYPDQVFDESPDVTIVFKWIDKGPYREKIKSLPGHKVIYQVDDLRFPHIRTMMTEMRSVCDHALTFDDDGAALALKYGYKTAKKMLLTADNLLYRHMPGLPKDIDVCFIGSLSLGQNHASRVKMVDIVSKIPGIKLAVTHELFDIGKVCEIYNRSKIILNHATDVEANQFGYGYGYQCRHFEAGFTKSCVLTNHVVNDRTLVNMYEFSDEKTLVENVKSLIYTKGFREVLAENFYNELNERHLPIHRGAELIQFARSIK